jgi:arsenate reductase-like glutaredoxin family protein
MNCSVCKNEIEHISLKNELDKIKILKNKIEEMSLKRLKFESRENVDDIIKENGRYFKNPLGYALNYFSYYICFECF